MHFSLIQFENPRTTSLGNTANCQKGLWNIKIYLWVCKKEGSGRYKASDSFRGVAVARDGEHSVTEELSIEKDKMLHTE